MLRQALRLRLADYDFSSLTSGSKYACDDGRRATIRLSSPSSRPMAMGFLGYYAAGRKIRAKGDTTRHFYNSLPATGQNPPPHCGFSATPYGEIGHWNCWSEAIMK